MRKQVLAVLFATSLFCSHDAWAACTVTYSFTTGTTAVAAQVNQDFADLTTCALPASGGTLTSGTLSGTTNLPNGIITSTGNLGIGTTSPLARLHTDSGTSATTAIAGLIYGSTQSGTFTDPAGLTPSKATFVVGSDWNNGNSSGAGLINAYNASGSMLWVGNSGKIGIGTTTPWDNTNSTLAPTSRIVDLTGTNPIIALHNTGDTLKEVSILNYTGGTYIDSTGSATAANNAINFRTSNTNSDNTTLINAMTIASTGNVGIGMTGPAYLLDVGTSSAAGVVMRLTSASGACTHSPGSGSETVSCSSDLRLKEDIVDAGDALGSLGAMRVRDFTVRATGERRTGVIAQELLKTRPEMVHMGPDGYYKVDEPNLWVLVKAIQQQQAELKELQAVIQQLESANSALRERVDKMSNSQDRGDSGGG